jgi:hypothetical protein
MTGPEGAEPGAKAAEARRARSRSRSEERDAAARAALEPLAPGERPHAVTVAAVVAAILAVVQLAGLVVALSAGGQRAGLIAYQVILIAVLAVAAAGMWRARYWAVLGMQALLGIVAIMSMLFLLLYGGLDLDSAVALVLLLGGGTLFWFLVKAMARLQMPSRP